RRVPARRGKGQPPCLRGRACRHGARARRAGIGWLGLRIALTALAFRPVHAHAQPGAPVRLEWSAPLAECPSRAAVLARVAAYARGGAVARSGVDARAAVSRRGTRWHVDVRIAAEGVDGARAFDAESCEAVADAVAFAVALAVDPAQA